MDADRRVRVRGTRGPSAHCITLRNDLAIPRQTLLKFERLAVAQTTGVAALGDWSHAAMLPARARSWSPERANFFNCQRGGALTRANSPHVRWHAAPVAVRTACRSLLARCRVRSATWSPATCVARPRSGRMVASATSPQCRMVAAARWPPSAAAMPPPLVAWSLPAARHWSHGRPARPHAWRRGRRGSATGSARLAGAGWSGAATAGTGG